MLDKHYYRKKYLHLRKEMDFKQVRDYSKQIMKTLTTMDVYKESSSVYGYMSFNNEVDTYGITESDTFNKKNYYAPVMKKNGLMTFHKVDGFNGLVINSYGIMEPNSQTPIAIPQEGDLVLVPGIVFDTSGYRIGYGGGYYDRLIRSHPEATYIGMTYDSHLCKEPLPVESYDQKSKLYSDTIWNC